MDAMATKRQKVSSSCNALQFRILVAVAVFVVVCFFETEVRTPCNWDHLGDQHPTRHVGVRAFQGCG